MSIEIKEYHAQLTTVTESSLKVVPLRGDLVVYQLTSNCAHTHQGEFRITRPSTQSFSEGIAFQEDIESFLARKNSQEKALSIQNDIPTNCWTFLTRDGRDYIAQNGCIARDKQGEQIMRKALIDRPYTALVNEEVTVDDLVCFAGGGYMIFDADLNPLPTGIYMDYIDARFSNRMYDLKKASQILRARNDIQFFNDQGHRINPNKTSVIFNIPHYNRETCSNRCMYLMWTPSQEDMKKLWEKCKEISPPKKVRRREVIDTTPGVERHRAIFEADLLGLRAGGAALYDDFFFRPSSYDTSDEDVDRAEDWGQFDEDDD